MVEWQRQPVPSEGVAEVGQGREERRFGLGHRLSNGLPDLWGDVAHKQEEVGLETGSAAFCLCVRLLHCSTSVPVLLLPGPFVSLGLLPLHSCTHTHAN